MLSSSSLRLALASAAALAPAPKLYAAAQAQASALEAVEEALLKDITEAYVGHDASTCTSAELANATSFSFDWPGTNADSDWYADFIQYEEGLFQATMSHADANGKSWEIRIGTGGNMYSHFAPDLHGETIPPQKHASGNVAPWIDEVQQTVSVNLELQQSEVVKNDAEHPQYCPVSGNCRPYYIHQAGAYQVDSPFMDNEPFFSPSLARHCSGNSCLFASWGTNAHVPTPFTSPIMYINKYTNCGDGIIEHTQMIHNFADPDNSDFGEVDQTYFNVGWGGVRSSTLPFALEPNPADGTLSYDDPDTVDYLELRPWGYDGGSFKGSRQSLTSLGGYTSFVADGLRVNHASVSSAEIALTLWCQTISTGAMVRSCTDAQVDSGTHKRIELRVLGNSSPSCATGTYQKGVAELKCNFRDVGFGPTHVYLSSPDTAHPWVNFGFKNTRTGEVLEVAYVRHWSWLTTNQQTLFSIIASSKAAARDKVNDMFDNSNNSTILPIEIVALTPVSQGANYTPSALSAFTFVYGKGGEYSQGLGGQSRRRVGSTAQGVGQRDYTVFTINWLGNGARLEAGSTYTNKAFMFTGPLGAVKATADGLVDKTHADEIDLERWNPRSVEIYADAANSRYAVLAAHSAGINSTVCGTTASLACAGHSTPRAGHLPLFRIECGSSALLGFDPYRFAPPFNGDFPGHGDFDNMVRSYACEGEADTVRPGWKLMGFFNRSDSCWATIQNFTYDEEVCALRPTTSPTTPFPTTSPTASPTSSPSTSPTKSPTSSPSTSPSHGPSTAPTTPIPSRSPSASPTSSPSTAPSHAPSTSPTNQPTASPTTESPTSSPSTSPTKSPTSSPSTSPSHGPTTSPTTPIPTTSPSASPTSSPSTAPSRSPSTSPTKSPTSSPSTAPSRSPSTSPTTPPPTTSPTTAPPTTSPSKRPTRSPSTRPTKAPSDLPTTRPTFSQDTPVVEKEVTVEYTTVVTKATVQSTLTLDNIGEVPDEGELRDAFLDALTKTLKQTIENTLAGNQSLEGVRIISIGGTPVGRRRLLDVLLGRLLEGGDGDILWESVVAENTTVVTVKDSDGEVVEVTVDGVEASVSAGNSDVVSTVASSEAISSGIAQKVSQAMVTATTSNDGSSGNAFMETFQLKTEEVADSQSDDVKALLTTLVNSVAVESVETDLEQEVVTTQESTTTTSTETVVQPVVTTVKVEGSITFSNTAISATQTAEFVIQAELALKNNVCPAADAYSCKARVLSVNGQSVTSRLRRHSRFLQESLVLQYEMELEAICSSADCSDAQTVGNALYALVTGTLRTAIEDGSIVASLRAVSTDFATLLASATATGSFTELVVPVLNVLSNWYPNWRDGTNNCLNDGNAPTYMKIFGTYFESSLDACCDRFFSWDTVECKGDSASIPSGFYPNWAGTKTKCLNSTEMSTTVPGYMAKNPEQWLFNDIESCCEQYYSWVYKGCIGLSSGNSVDSGTDKWYVNHQEEICQQDCPEEGMGACGGLATPWDQLYASAAVCCAEKLSWITPSTCEAQSSLATAVGTSRWYVDWVLEKCVKDCSDSSDASCGGLAKSWDQLYGSSGACCGRISYIERDECTLS